MLETSLTFRLLMINHQVTFSLKWDAIAGTNIVFTEIREMKEYDERKSFCQNPNGREPI